jgi:hypothetical protein
MLNTVKILGLLARLCGCSSTYDGRYVPQQAYVVYPFEMPVRSGVVGSKEVNVTVAQISAANEAHCWAIADAMERGANKGVWVQPISCRYAGE